MQYVVTAKEMKTYDENTIRRIGIPSAVLMERAALAVVEELKCRCGNLRDKKILVVAGCGNNGGDGIAVGRMLAAANLAVEFVLVGDRQHVSSETQRQITIAENLGFSIQSKSVKTEYDIVVDALFGVGLSRPVEGIFQEWVEKMNSLRRQGAMIVSVDIPSGICADDGKVLGAAVTADWTVTFAYAKRGHLLYPGKGHTGKLLVRDIGIPAQAHFGQAPAAFCYGAEDIEAALPRRQPDGNKGTFGKVLLAAGSYDMCGAALLCGESILRTGAGMVKIITPACNREIIQKTLPEAMLYSYEEQPKLAVVEQAVQWADVIVAGPGMGTGNQADLLLSWLLLAEGKPVVLDADGLNLIAAKEELLRRAGRLGKKLVITPHPGELVRLLDSTMEQYRQSRGDLVCQIAEMLGCTVVAKDAATIVKQAGREQIYINTSGCDGMATAGSGDVLAGMIGGLLAQKMKPFEAAAAGVYLHGLAGMRAAKRLGSHAVMASDLIPYGEDEGIQEGRGSSK